jgi:serine/threonine protein kinase
MASPLAYTGQSLRGITSLAEIDPTGTAMLTAAAAIGGAAANRTMRGSDRTDTNYSEDTSAGPSGFSAGAAASMNRHLSDLVGVPQVAVHELRPLLCEANLIARGAFGDVYRIVLAAAGASHQHQDQHQDDGDSAAAGAGPSETGIPVAVKSLRVNASSQAVKEFAKEVKFLHTLSHDSVVRVLAFAAESRGLMIVTEWMEHGSLLDLLERTPRPPLRDFLSMLCDAARGMRYLHSLGIVHRDLKPANILVGAGLRAKLGDFGLARNVDNSVAETTSLAGTPAYVSPEVFRGDAITTGSDVYSFAVLMWEVFARQKPWVGQSFIDLVRNVGLRDSRLPLGEDVEFPDCAPETVDRCKNLIARCWISNPAERPTFEEITVELEQIAEAL